MGKIILPLGNESMKSNNDLNDNASVEDMAMLNRNNNNPPPTNQTVPPVPPVDEKTDVELGEDGKPIVKTDEPNTSSNDDEELKEGSVIEIDGTDYTLDKDGNALLDGNVVYTKDQLEETEDVPASTISKLIELSQIKPVSDDGAELEYPDTDEGYKKYIEDVYTAGGLDKAQEILGDYYKNYPEVKAATDYIIANGSLEGYSEKATTHIPITDDSVEADLINVIKTARSLKGDSDEEIDSIIAWAKADGKLLNMAKSSEAFVKSTEEAEALKIAQKAQEIETNRIQKNEKYKSDIKAVVDKGLIKIGEKEISIPKKLSVKTDNGVKVVDRTALVEYSTKLGLYKIGEETITATQYQIDKMMRNNRKNINDDIYDMISLFTKQDISQILNAAITNDKAKAIKKQFQVKSPKNTNTVVNGNIVLPLK